MSDDGEFRRGSGIVASAAIGIALGLSPLPFYTLGVFAPHLAAEFGWTMAQIMAGLSIMTVIVVLAGPVAGWLADRYGVRRVTLTSLVMFAFALMGFSLLDGDIRRYWLTWGVLSMVGMGTMPATWTRAINVWFEERKGLALGLALTGTGIAGMLLPTYTHRMIDRFGWRGGYIALALLPLLIALPLAARFLHPAPADVVKYPQSASAATGLSLGDATRDWRFWLIGAAFLPIAFAIGGPIPNMRTILATHGLGDADIVSVLPSIGLFVIVGRLLGGWLIDRLWAPAVAFVMLSIPAALQPILLQDHISVTHAVLLLAGLGLAAGMEYDLLAFLAARYFGAAHYGAIYGALYSFFAVGAGFASMIYAHAYDVSHSFDHILKWGAGGMAGGAVLLIGLGRYRYAPRN
jgi:predicted MFS family arabinose efflux permease